jgi:hypothetical protein
MAQETSKLRAVVLPAGPLKRVWVNKHCLPQFGGTDPYSPAWEVEVHLRDVAPGRYSGYRAAWSGDTAVVYSPGEPEHGPHAWVETQAEVVVYQAVEEAA